MLAVSATDAQTKGPRFIVNAESSIDARVACSRLPQLFPAVEIDGGAYWDFGCTGNQPPRPLIDVGVTVSLIVVRTTPDERRAVLANSVSLGERTKAIAFSAALRHQIWSVAIAPVPLRGVRVASVALQRLHSIRLHIFGVHQALSSLGGASGEKRRPSIRWRQIIRRSGNALRSTCPRTRSL
jgi:NTE family protein